MLLVNGSPRRGGLVAQWLDTVGREAAHHGFAVETIAVADLDVCPCTGCMACRSRKACVLPADGAQRLLAALEAADALVVGAPCYWGNMPGQLKLLFDRMVYGLIDEGPHGMPRPLMKGKRAALIVTCSTPWPWNRLLRQSGGTARALRDILKWAGIRTVAVVQQGGTRGRRSLPARATARCRRIVSRL